MGLYRPRQLGSQAWSLKQELYAARIDAHRWKPTNSVVGGCHELESAFVSHPAVAEAAVVARPDPVKGESELKRWVRERFGAIAEPSDVFFVTRLPRQGAGR